MHAIHIWRQSTRAAWKLFRATVGTLFAVMMGTVMIAYCTRFFTGTMEPSWWCLLIACILAGLYWCERIWPSPTWRALLRDLYIESRCGTPPRIEHSPDGTVVQEYLDGTRVTWKDGRIVNFEFATQDRVS